MDNVQSVLQVYNGISKLFSDNGIQVQFTGRGYPIDAEEGFCYGYEFFVQNKKGLHRIVYSLEQRTYTLIVITPNMGSNIFIPIENASLNELLNYF